MIGNQWNSTLSLFGILLLCRDDIAYLSEGQLLLEKVFLLSRPRPTTVRSGSTITRTSCAVKENWRDWGYHRANWDRCPIKITKKVITYFIIPQLIAMELLLNSLVVAMARS